MAEWAILISAIGVFIGAMRFVSQNGKDQSKAHAEIYKEIERKEKQYYDDFPHIKLCQTNHETISKNLSEIKKDQKDLVVHQNDIRNAVARIDTTIKIFLKRNGINSSEFIPKRRETDEDT